MAGGVTVTAADLMYSAYLNLQVRLIIPRAQAASADLPHLLLRSLALTLVFLHEPTGPTCTPYVQGINPFKPGGPLESEAEL